MSTKCIIGFVEKNKKVISSIVENDIDWQELKQVFAKNKLEDF